jgi:uncharacterized protein (TIGR03435 family)
VCVVADMKLSRPAVFVLSFGAIGAASSQAQSAVPRVPPRSFEVASIKPNLAGGDSRRAGASPGGIFTATNVNLKLLISRAFGVAESQIQGGPRWIDTETYDISAKANTPLEMSREELRPCLQALLAERFHLTIHRGTKEGTVYSLIVAKSGPKLKEHSGAGGSGIAAASVSGKADITATKTTVTRLAEYLSGQAGRPVIDNTGLKGEYDFRVEWATDEALRSSGSSIFTVLQEQLGLKLDATKGPIEVIVVDGAERASAN